MASSRKFLHPLKQSLAVIASSSSFRSHPRQFLYARFGPLTRLTKGFGPVIRSRFSGIQCNSCTQRISFHNSYFSGSKVRIGTGILAVSAILGSISFRPRVSYAMNELDVLGHDDMESWRASDVEDKPNVLWKFAKKFWLPVFFFVTLLSHLDDPLTMIAFKAILFLLSTNPSPFSVYVIVNELCRRSMHQEPYLYNAKSLYAHKVQVQDYKLLCLAKVEVRDQKFTLLGILGGWWALPLISDGTFSLLRPKALEQC